MLIDTVRFGKIEVDDKQVFTFEYGLPGFASENKFAFLPHEDGTNEKPSFAYLQSVKTPELTFLLADPFVFFPDYEFEIDNGTEQLLGTSLQNLPMVWSIGMLLNKVEDMTINLVAPVLFNIENRKALQLILDGTKYKTRHRIFGHDIQEETKDKAADGEDAVNVGTEQKNR